ncbi:MAG: hypothetical protein CME62_17500 [Halobacteriovoraceae bacterium]|nr:hypothetical protein [Halobacteriovoraceae bacterium]|tara:strand:- start:39972 stop:40877 length:906 start_codon:yes stop_codon:yes gene_type:complete
MKINKRTQESISPHLSFSPQKDEVYSRMILTSPSDQGVMRNLGRNGACYGPEALINSLKKFNSHFKLKDNEKFLIQNVWQELQDSFEANQNASANLIAQNIEQHTPQKLVHLGGGHDHIYPLLKGIEQSEAFKNIVILNLDAHCDTRVDTSSHSGTPFRDYDRQGDLPFHLIQFGIHEYANSRSTLEKLKRGSEEHYFYNQSLHQDFVLKDLLTNIPFKIGKETAFVLSLDCDGIQGESMPAVSCVNSNGIKPEQVFHFIQELNKWETKSFFGVYEFNPVYDTPSHYGRRLISHFVYEYLK